jgi:hypothetical protein
MMMRVAGLLNRAMPECYGRICIEAERAALDSLSSPNSRGAVYQIGRQIPSPFSASGT